MYIPISLVTPCKAIRIPDSGFRNLRHFRLWNRKSGKILPSESGIPLSIEIQNPRSIVNYWNPTPAIRNPGLSWILSHGATFAIGKAMLTSHVRLLLLKYEVNHQSSCPFFCKPKQNDFMVDGVEAFERSMIMTLLKSPLS